MESSIIEQLEPVVQTPLLTVTLKDGTPFVMYSAWPKQVAFHKDPTTNLIAIGSRGSGKSLALRFDAHMRALSCPGSSLILIRKTYRDLLKSHIYFQGLPWGSLKQEMALLGGTFHATDYICHYPNGSKLFLSYVGHDTDSMNLLSAEFLAAYFDELSVIPWEFFLKLCASVRVAKNSGLSAVVRAATNPLGESAAEVNKYFVTKDVDIDEDQDYLPDEWNHVRIDMQDNPSLDLVQYRKRFAGLSDHVKRAWLDGEFSDEDALFTFHASKDGKPYHIIQELDLEAIIKASKIYRVFDWGWSPDPSYCAWIAHLGNRYIVIQEKVWYKTIASEIAASMLEEDERLGIQRVVATYCDPTLEMHTGVDVRTVKDVFEANGIPMECSVNNREQFAAAVHTALAEEALPGVPRLQIYTDPYRRHIGAPYMAKTIPMQRYDIKRPLALANHRHDHPTVGLAYFLISHSSNEQRTFTSPKVPRWMRPKKAEHQYLGHDQVRHSR